MLSFIGELATCSGVGDGSAEGSTDACREFFATTFPAAPLAIANVLSERPKAHANAQVLTATFLKCLGIIPSTGLTDLPPRARSKMPASEHSLARRTSRQLSLVVKGERTFLSPSMCVQGIWLMTRSGLRSHSRNLVIAFPDCRAWQFPVPEFRRVTSSPTSWPQQESARAEV